MKALILAAGMGSRMREYTTFQPKCLIAFRERSLIDYQIASLRHCGISEIIVVGGYRIDVLKKHLAGCGVTVIHNEHYETTNMVVSLLAAADHFNEDMIISYGDIIYKPTIVKALLSSQSAISVVVDRDWQELWDLRFEDPLSDAETLKLNADNTIKEIGKKPISFNEIEAQYIGLMRFSKEALQATVKLYKSLDSKRAYDGRSIKQMYMTTLLQMIISQGTPIEATKVHGGWLEFDSVEDLAIYEKTPCSRTELNIF